MSDSLASFHQHFVAACESVKIGHGSLAPLMALDYGSWRRVESNGDSSGYGLLYRWGHAVLDLEVVVAEYRTGFEALVRQKDAGRGSVPLLRLDGGRGLDVAQGAAAWFMLLQQRGLSQLPAILKFRTSGTLYAATRCGSCEPAGREVAGDAMRQALRDLRGIMEAWNPDAEAKAAAFEARFRDLVATLDALATPQTQAARRTCHMGSSCPGPSRFVDDTGCSTMTFQDRDALAWAPSSAGRPQ